VATSMSPARRRDSRRSSSAAFTMMRAVDGRARSTAERRS
jgi:hypothetical protein